jgi:hypothetical protein
VPSPHEIATLILVKDAPKPFDPDPADLESLLEHQLVTLEKPSSGQACPLLTHRGHFVLKAVGRSG